MLSENVRNHLSQIDDEDDEFTPGGGVTPVNEYSIKNGGETVLMD